MESVRFGGLGGDEIKVGTSVSAELTLQHPGLDSRELEVEAVVAYGTKPHERASRMVVPFEANGNADRSTWKGAFSVRASGGHELRFRVRPRERAPMRAGAIGLHIQKWL
jgi:hypothetical protein